MPNRVGATPALIVELLGVRMLGALPAATIEQLAAGLEHAVFAPRAVVFEQSEHGGRFYVVEPGRAEVTRDARGRGLLRRDRPLARPAANPEAALAQQSTIRDTATRDDVRERS
jgi:hypothetical protein